MATVQLGAKAVGSIVKLNESGVLTDYIIVQKGRPDHTFYTTDTDGIWLFRKERIYEMPIRPGSTQSCKTVADYVAYLEGNVLPLYDAKIRDAIKATAPFGGKKLFHLSHNELGITEYRDNSGTNVVRSDSAKLSYFLAGPAFAYGTAVDPANAANKLRADPSPAASAYTATRSTFTTSSTSQIPLIASTGAVSGPATYNGAAARPAMILPATLYVTDSGIVVFNVPTAPSSIAVPTAVKGGEALAISWGASTSGNGTISSYRLERSVNGGAWTQIYSGTALSHTDTITKGWGTVAYRVRAFDSAGADSDYTTSPTRTVQNNTAPTITSPFSGDLGTKDEGFAVTYTVDDADGDTITVTESVDGEELRSYTAELGAESTLDLSGDTFMQLLNGSHTIAVTAIDPDGASDALTLTFTKAVHALRVTLKEPLEADEPITKAVLSVTGSIPADAAYSVLLTNNAKDDPPIWEDATTLVLTGRNYLFENTIAQNGPAFNFLITASRGTSGVGGHISAVGGAFE